MTWSVEYFKEAKNDLTKFDHSQKLHILKAIEKVSQNPLPANEGGYGKPLGNHNSARLAGYYKIKLLKLGVRIVYGLIREDEKMRIIVISIRDDDEVYKTADKRVR
jgi:mRNA interferase RelE/StbE